MIKRPDSLVLALVDRTSSSIGRWCAVLRLPLAELVQHPARDGAVEDASLLAFSA